MDWTEVKINVSAKDVDKAGDIAQMVVPYGIYVEDYSELEKDALEIAHIDLIDEELIKKDRTVSIIHIYISNEENPFEAAEYLKERYSAVGIKSQIETDNVNDASWADNWKKFFKVTEIGEKLVIRPSWEDYDNKSGRVVLSIDPGAAFGTGTHATTRMCLSLVEKYVDKGCEVLDIGSGSGILSIAAALLGAEKVDGVDIDPVAVKVSNENAEINNVQNIVNFKKGDLLEEINGKYDVICANIVADVIIALLETVPQFMKPQTLFLCSGIIDIREDDVKSAFEKFGFKIVDELESENWRAFAVIKQ